MSDPMIDRLGFAAWADNLIADALENLVEPVSVEIESDKAILVFRVEDGYVHATIRAYVPGIGWHYHDRVIKNNVANQSHKPIKGCCGQIKAPDDQGEPSRSGGALQGDGDFD